MASDEYYRVELPALEQLRSLGWSYVEGERLSPEHGDERGSFRDAVLERRLADSMARINPWINDENLRRVVQGLTRGQHASLMEANRDIWQQITRCVSVMQDLGRGKRGQTVRIIDFDNPDNNEFLCANQFKVSGPSQSIVPDIVCFVNGLPMAVIECKSPWSTNPMQKGIDQLLRYANLRGADDEGAERLFHHNLMMVSTHRDGARVGTISSRMEHYLEWKDPYPRPLDKVGGGQTGQDVLLAGLFARENFLDILQNFTVFEPVDGRIIKKMARYQQFRAVHKAIKRIRSRRSLKARSGVIWHTQGSGKSLTMVFLAIKMRRDPQLRDYKLVFVTDRTQLDNQLVGTFANAQGETIRHAGSVRQLRELLAGDASDIVMAMMQKFRGLADGIELPVLNESDKILVLADEAHRTQYGALGAAINAALPNAPRIAFTGTPLLRSQKTARAFGSHIDKYTIEQAVRDGATVQILYEGRKPEVRVTGDSLDSLFDEYFEGRSDADKEAIRKRYGTRRAILEAPQRIRRVCIDMIRHYREHIQPNGLKAMIVTSSRQAAITYKEQLDKLEAPQSAVIISGDHNDGERFRQYTDSTLQQQQIEDFKKPMGVGDGQSQLSFLIVKDMLLTGFDAPVAQVMYLDQKLSDHTLLQAIARVNRIHEKKFRGHIVDYYGLSDYLAEALEMFSADDVQGALVEMRDEIPRLQAAHTRVIKHFAGMDMDDPDDCIISLEDAAGRRIFQEDFRAFARQMDIVLPGREAAPYLQDLKRLGRIALGAGNRYRDAHLGVAGAGEKVRELIEEHVYSTGVNPKIPPVELFAGGYREFVNRHKSPRARASEIEHAIRHHLRVHMDEDPEYCRKLSERLEQIIREHEEQWEDMVESLLKLRDSMKDGRQRQAESLGLSPIELPFYDIFIAELGAAGAGAHDGAMEQSAAHDAEEAIDAATLQQAKDAVRSLVRMLQEETQIVGFFDKWDERRKMERKIKHALIEIFDESHVGTIVKRFMELAEVRFR